MTAPARPDVSAALSRDAAAVEKVLEQVLPEAHGRHARVLEAMRYATFAGGKRLRPYLTLAGARLFGVPEARALRAAAAIEVLHTYSLVHDDLPCMDDDDLRRGRPTTHRKFDEATAVLAGDGLLTIAFEILADPATHPSGEVRARLVSRLAKAAGGEGMIGGQMMDMQSALHDYDQDEIILLQRMKTGALFEFSAEAGAILAEAGDEHQARLRSFRPRLRPRLPDRRRPDRPDRSRRNRRQGGGQGSGPGQADPDLHLGHRRRAHRITAAGRQRRRSPVALRPCAAVELRALPYYLLDRTA